MPECSVIIPVYNSEKYLRECIESVLNQTFKDIEIICVNDGSTDNSSDILKEFKDGRIILIEQDRFGQGYARNKALDRASGKYIYFLDSDDYIEPNLLEECVKILEDTNAGLVCFNTEIIGDKSSGLFKRAAKYSQLKFSGLHPLNGSYLDTLNVYLWNKVFRFDTIEKYKLRFPAGLCYEDIGFSKTYFLISDTIYFCMKRFHHYRIHNDSIMSKSFKSKDLFIDHFKNWHVIMDNISAEHEILIKNKNTLEKWFWDYYFMTKSMIEKESGKIELEKLKERYFADFMRLISV